MLDAKSMKTILFRSLFLITVIGIMLPSAVSADDGASSIAAGGLVFKRETRIVMAKEVLQISPTKVVVDYDFRNDTNEDVTTEVAFPVPPYENGSDLRNISDASFHSFRLWIDGKPTKYDSEVKATLKGKDVTNILQRNHVDIVTFGHFKAGNDPANDYDPSVPDFEHLPESKKKVLIKAGLFDESSDNDFWKLDRSSAIPLDRNVPRSLNSAYSARILACIRKRPDTPGRRVDRDEKARQATPAQPARVEQ